jgi:dTDP-glucose 4,6-dehydratase
MPVLITRSSNNYGPYQYPEKLIPLMIANALDGRSLPVYGDGLQVRDWIHVSDHCRAIEAVLQKGRAGEVYNVGGGNEKANIDIVRHITGRLNVADKLIKHVDDRLGHDRRYALDCTKMTQELNWTPETVFDKGLDDTIDWYVAHKDWIDSVYTLSPEKSRNGFGRMKLKEHL